MIVKSPTTKATTTTRNKSRGNPDFEPGVKTLGSKFINPKGALFGDEFKVKKLETGADDDSAGF